MLTNLPLTYVLVFNIHTIFGNDTGFPFNAFNRKVIKKRHGYLGQKVDKISSRLSESISHIRWNAG